MEAMRQKIGSKERQSENERNPQRKGKNRRIVGGEVY